MDDVPKYPKRPAFFANKFCRLMNTICLANELGPEACWLLAIVAHQEDQKGYRSAVTYFNEQLMPLVGFKSVDTLARVRAKVVEAGWLHYETRYHAAGVYWVEVPEELAHFITKDGVSDSAPKRKQAKNKPESGAEEFPHQRGNKPESPAETNQNYLRKQVRNHPPMPLPWPLPLSDPPNPPQPGGTASPGEENPAKEKTTDTGNTPPVTPPPALESEPKQNRLRKKQDPGPKVPRERNPLFDAIVDVTGETAGSHIGKIAAELSQHDPPFTAEDVCEFSQRYWELCPWAKEKKTLRPTTGEVLKYIGRIRASPAPVPKVNRPARNDPNPPRRAGGVS